MPPPKASSSKPVAAASSSTKSKQPPTRTKPKSAPTENPLPNLVEQLATLSINVNGKGKGKKKAIVSDGISSEQQRREVMLAINTSSQALSPSVHSGFKATKVKTSEDRRTQRTLENHAKDALKGLNVLRQGGSTVQVERVASSIVQKLVALEMVASALESLTAMRLHLLNLYGATTTTSDPTLFLPLPTNPLTDESTLILISTYLLHVLAVQPTSSVSAPDLLVWADAGHFNTLSQSHTDALYTRAYTILKPHHQPFGLYLLLHTSTGVVQPSAFWASAIAVVTSYKKDEDASIICNEILRRASHDRWTEGPGFAKFSQISKESTKQTDKSNAMTRTLSDPIPLSGFQPVKEYAKVYTSLTQCTADLPAAEALTSAKALLPSCSSIFIVAPDEPLESAAAREKVGRAFGRLRRATHKLLDVPTWEDDLESAKDLLEGIAEIHERTLADQASHDADILTQALDSFFLLARITLQPNIPSTYASSYAYLARAFQVITLPHQVSTGTNISDCMRCLSAAYFNLAGTLYKSGRHAGACRFAKEACQLGAKALEMQRSLANTQMNDDGNAKERESWTSLEKLLWRRWELLGICEYKTGEKKTAFEAFVQCIKTYSYDPSDITSGFIPEALCSIVDRLTYIATLELFVPPSLYLLVDRVNPLLMGALLERQIASLEDGSAKISVRAAIGQILADLLGVFDSAYPVRRSRSLIRCLEFAYKAPDSEALWDAEAVGQEVSQLLAQENLGNDSDLKQFLPQYQAAAKLWLALHSYRSQKGRMAEYIEEACEIIDLAYLHASESPMPKKKSPKVTVSKVTKKAVATKIKTSKVSKTPTTPKSRKASGTISLNTVSPPRTSVQKSNNALQFDDSDSFLSLLVMASRYVGLSGPDSLKIRVLAISWKLCECYPGISQEFCATVSIELANEQLKLGYLIGASKMYNQTLDVVRKGELTDDISCWFFLRYALCLASSNEDTQSSSAYSEAVELSRSLAHDDKIGSTSQRIRTKSQILERAAIAFETFAQLRYFKDDVVGAMDAMLRSLRLWNRAFDNLERLKPPAIPQSTEVDVDPFASPETPQVPTDEADRPSKPTAERTYHRHSPLDGLEWRVAQGICGTLFTLAEWYLARGSPREANFFAQQAQDFGESLQLPGIIGRAWMRKAEVQLLQGKLGAAWQSLQSANNLLDGVSGLDESNLRRLTGDYHALNFEQTEAHKQYTEGAVLWDNFNRKTQAVLETMRARTSTDSLRIDQHFAPWVLAATLRQHLWLLRNESTPERNAMLTRFLAITSLPATEFEHHGLMARLTLHDVYGRFEADMFLRSLTESTIALPVCAPNQTMSVGSAAHDILNVLENAKQFFWTDLKANAYRGSVAAVRRTNVSLAMIKALQTYLGAGSLNETSLVADFLNASSAVTLRREMIEIAIQKFPENRPVSDEIGLPMISQTRPSAQHSRSRNFLVSTTASIHVDDEDDVHLKSYWSHISARHASKIADPLSISTALVDSLPAHWTVINIGVTDDRSNMFVSRQRAMQKPLVFCLPLKGRRESDDDEHLTFDDALNELKSIIDGSNESTKRAIHVKNDDPSARAQWWDERRALDKRLQELLHNIEFCWLGAFKTILTTPTHTSLEVTADLRERLNKVFKRCLQPQERRRNKQISLDDTVLQCFSTLSPKCPDAELEDVIYFIMDLYQFQGIPVATAEVDIDAMMVDLRTALEDHTIRARKNVTPESDQHIFLILDKNTQGIPWESIPSLRGKSVSRIPSMEFLIDRLDFAQMKSQSSTPVDRAPIDGRNAFYMLNPSGDLAGTETRFAPFLRRMGSVGWQGIIGQAPSEQQFLNALENNDLVIYFGHGGGEQYARSNKIRALAKCAAVMLWGCSSGDLKEMGEFDRVGTPYNYMLAGCPTLVANLWDVTDRDIDKFCQAVFDDTCLTFDGICHPRQSEKVSLVAAVAHARIVCKLPYLTGAAPVVYGIPFYL